MTATTAPDITDLVARLKEKERALGDPLDVPRTTRAFEAYWKQRRALADTISALANLPADVRRRQAELADLEQRRTEVTEKRDDFVRQIAAFIDPQSLSNARERDAEFERQRDLRRRLERLDEGTLLKNPDETYEPAAYLDRRVAELQREVASLRLRLDACLRQAELLLDEPVTT
jgi:hypothetical protein